MARMQTQLIDGLTVRPLRAGDSATVQAVFDRLGPRSRHARFGGAKNVLTPAELAHLSRVDGDHHVLVAVLEGEPVGIARLVREGPTADVALAVADEHQGRGIGTVLVERLAADARAAGIETLTATIDADNTRSLALARRLTRRDQSGIEPLNVCQSQRSPWRTKIAVSR
jgi:L-amino acid N-acyltransferase YncA